MGSRQGKRYTPEEDALIASLAGKVHVPDIASALGRTKYSVYERCRRIGVSCRMRGEAHWAAGIDDLKAAMLTALYNAGFTAKEIHRALVPDMKYRSVWDICARRNRKEDSDKIIGDEMSLVESAIEKKYRQVMKDRGWAVYKFTSPGHRGVPDRLLLRDYRQDAIEILRGRGIVLSTVSDSQLSAAAEAIVACAVRFTELKTQRGQVRPWQAREHERLRALGFRVAVVRSLEDLGE